MVCSYFKSCALFISGITFVKLMICMQTNKVQGEECIFEVKQAHNSGQCKRMYIVQETTIY